MRDYKREMLAHAKKMGIKVPRRRGDAYLGDYILASNERDRLKAERDGYRNGNADLHNENQSLRKDNQRSLEVIRQYENALNRIVDETKGKARDIAIEAMTT